MTIPSTTILPLHSERIQEGGKALDQYLRELIFSLQRQYEEMAQAINGDIKRSVDEGSQKWEPLLKDSGDTTLTFIYDHQIGIVLRKGLIVDVFFDIKWTGCSGIPSGNMYIELPYKVSKSEGKPFIGVLQPSIFAYTGGTDCVINAIPDTYHGEIWNTGNGFVTANQLSTTVGHLIGNLRYVGQQTERS